MADALSHLSSPPSTPGRRPLLPDPSSRASSPGGAGDMLDFSDAALLRALLGSPHQGGGGGGGLPPGLYSSVVQQALESGTGGLFAFVCTFCFVLVSRCYDWIGKTDPTLV
jgi:hypothetical protein